MVESIAGGPTVDPKPEVSFARRSRLREDGRVSGSTGVNRLLGTYEDHGESLTTLGGGTSRMAGQPEAMEQESRFFAAFTRAPRGTLSVLVARDRLQLGDSKTGPVLLEAPSDPATAETVDWPDPSR